MCLRPVEVVRSNVLMTNCYVGPDGVSNALFGQVYFNNSPGIRARGWIQNLPSAAHAQPMPRDLHATMYGNAAPGETFDYGIAGPPNGFALMVLGAYATSPASSPLGDVWLLPQALSVVANVPLDAQGYHWGSLSVPAGVGSPFVFGLQSLLVGPGGTLEVSRATPFVLGWQSNLSPY